MRAYEDDFNGNLVYSLPATKTQPTGAWPNAPTGLTATAASDTEIDLTWAESAGSGGASNVDHCEVWRSPDDGGTTDNWTEVGTAIGQEQTDPITGASFYAFTYDDKTVTTGEETPCYYEVRAVDGSGHASGYSAAASATTLPATPTGLTASFVDGSTVTLTWNNRSNLETGYSIQELESDGVTWQEIQTTTNTGSDTIGPMSVSVIGAFDPSTTPYKFRVEAYDDSNDVYSAASNEAQATAQAWAVTPDLTAIPDTTDPTAGIDLSWVDSDTSVTGYNVFRSTDGTTWTAIATIPEITNPITTNYNYPDMGLTEGATYYYRVQAVNAVGDSGYATATAAPMLLPPTDVHATVYSGHEIEVTWGDQSANATEYSVEQNIDGSWVDVDWEDGERDAARFLPGRSSRALPIASRWSPGPIRANRSPLRRLKIPCRRSPGRRPRPLITQPWSPAPRSTCRGRPRPAPQPTTCTSSRPKRASGPRPRACSPVRRSVPRGWSLEASTTRSA